MLSLELTGILGLLFGFEVYVMVVSQLERRSARIAGEKTEKAPAPGSEPVRTEH